MLQDQISPKAHHQASALHSRHGAYSYTTTAIAYILRTNQIDVMATMSATGKYANLWQYGHPAGKQAHKPRHASDQQPFMPIRKLASAATCIEATCSQNFEGPNQCCTRQLPVGTFRSAPGYQASYCC
jgi:hypothetical protein